MSVTFETNAGKAITMVEGLGTHIDEVAHLGINTAELDALQAEANKANFPPERWGRYGIPDKR